MLYLNSTVPPVQRRRGRVCLQTPPSAWPPVSHGVGSARHRSGWSPGTRPLLHELTGNYWSVRDLLSPKNMQTMTIYHTCGCWQSSSLSACACVASLPVDKYEIIPNVAQTKLILIFFFSAATASGALNCLLSSGCFSKLHSGKSHLLRGSNRPHIMLSMY